MLCNIKICLWNLEIINDFFVIEKVKNDKINLHEWLDFYNLDCFDYEELHDDFYYFHNRNDIVISKYNMVVQLSAVIHNKMAVLLD